MKLLDTCCGMAGACGFEQGERYTVAVGCGERALLPAIREADRQTLIIADGFSCREQIAQGTDCCALHLAKLLHVAQSHPGEQMDDPLAAWHTDGTQPVEEAGSKLAALGVGMLAAGVAGWRILRRRSRMKTKLLYSEHGLRTFAVIFDKGDAFPGNLHDLARREGIDAAHFTAIGAFRSITLGYFERRKMDYRSIPVDEQVEVLTLAGNIARKDDGEIKVHAHVVVGKMDGSTQGGHLLDAQVWPTLELVLEETPAHLRRRADAETGLALIDLKGAKSLTAD